MILSLNTWVGVPPFLKFLKTLTWLIIYLGKNLDDMSTKIPGVGTFLYFGYGSNLFSKRIHINNPSAKKVSIARLDDYKLSFGHFSKGWGGATATIKPQKGSQVWGVVWEIDVKDLPSLDKQEGVPYVYQRLENKEVTTPESEKLSVLMYHLVKGLELDPVPSGVYHSIILKGAVENNLPGEYMEFLQGIKNNDFMGNEGTVFELPADPEYEDP